MKSGSKEGPPGPGGRWRRLRDRAIFRLTGPDRVRYLNGQVSNEVSGPLDREAVAACLCSIKGKVEALVWIQAVGDALILDGEACQRDYLHSRLQRYLVSDDCEIEDVGEGMALYHHFREDATGVASRRIGASGRDLLLTTGDPVPFPAGDEIGDEEWLWLETRALIPRSGWEIDGETFPAELGLDTWAVDFHKGCYLGQEIVSRIRSVGRVKRALRLVEGDRPFARGEVFAADATGTEGVATRPALARDGRFAGLALWPIASGDARAGSLREAVENRGGESGATDR